MLACDEKMDKVVTEIESFNTIDKVKHQWKEVRDWLKGN